MGSWTFVEPYLEWVLKTRGAEGRAAALRRAAGLGRDGDRPDVEAHARSCRPSSTRHSLRNWTAAVRRAGR